LEFLSAAERRAALQRPAQRDAKGVAAAAQSIIDAVRRNGDVALRELTERFDGASLSELRVSEAEFAAAGAR
jgi:histidinol dehydrogenase